MSADLIDEDGNPTQALVRNGELVAGVPSAIRLVTLTFLITGGDNYPFQSFFNADPTFANLVNLSESNVPPAGWRILRREAPSRMPLPSTLRPTSARRLSASWTWARPRTRASRTWISAATPCARPPAPTNPRP